MPLNKPTESVSEKYLNSGTGAVETDIHSILDSSPINVKWFGAIGDNVTDDTAAIQAAIDSLGSAAGTIYFPTGRYKTSSTIRVSYNRQNLVGEGRWATWIGFAPTANDTCVLFESTDSSVLYQNTMRDMTVFSSDSTYTKVGVNLVDTSAFILENMVIGGDVAVGNTGLFSGGTGSIGLQTNGREAGTFRNLHIHAETCISLKQNPNSVISTDHFHFSDCYLQGGTGGSWPIWNIDDGLYVSNLTIDGHQAWTGGNAGLVWVDTTSTQASHNFTISNVRHEGSTNAAGHIIQIETNSGLTNLTIRNCYGALDQLGIKLRTCGEVAIKDTFMLCTTGSALNVDSSVTPLKLDNFSRQAGSTVDVGTLVKVFDTGITGSGAPSFSYYQDPAVITTAIFNTPVSGTKINVPDNASGAADGAGTINIGTALTTQGMLFVSTNDNVGATYWLGGPADSVVEINVSSGGFFSPTLNTTSKYNIFYDSGTDTYRIENNRGSAKDIRYLLIGGVN